MYISNLSINNFKSFSAAQIVFDKLTMVVGANAAGKSNLINVFRFISDISNVGIDNAIALQGGISYLSNACLPKGTPISISFTLDLSHEGWVRYMGEKDIPMEIKRIEYSFSLKPNQRGNRFHILEDRIVLVFKYLEATQNDNKQFSYTDTGITYSVEAIRKSTKSKIFLNNSFSPETDIEESIKKFVKDDYTLKVFAKLCNEDNNELMLYRLDMLLPARFSSENFIRVFDFDPKELKRTTQLGSKTNLDENGANIANVLNSLLRSKEKRNKLTRILNEFLFRYSGEH